jgi:hypothetical protein
LKEGWPEFVIIKALQGYCRPGWLIIRFHDYKMFHDAAPAEIEMFLRYDLYDLRFFLLKKLFVFILSKIRIRERINHPGREISM